MNPVRIGSKKFLGFFERNPLVSTHAQRYDVRHDACHDTYYDANRDVCHDTRHDTHHASRRAL